MKKMTKIMLITALTLLIAGGLMTGAGIMAGASFETFASSTRENEFSSRCLRNLGRISHLDNRWERWEEQQEKKLEHWEDRIDDATDIDYDGNHHQKGKHDFETSRSFSLDQVESFSVEAENGEIEIEAGTGSEIVISNLCAEDVVDFEEMDKELYVSRCCEAGNQEPLLIEIPENKKFQEIDFETLSGNISVYGKIQANESSVGVESGNISIELLESRETDLDCCTGNLSLICKGRLTDYRVEIETENCNVKLDDQPHIGQIQGIFGDRNSQNTVNVEGSTGNITLSFENK